MIGGGTRSVRDGQPSPDLSMTLARRISASAENSSATKPDGKAQPRRISYCSDACRTAFQVAIRERTATATAQRHVDACDLLRMGDRANTSGAGMLERAGPRLRNGYSMNRKVNAESPRVKHTKPAVISKKSAAIGM